MFQYFSADYILPVSSEPVKNGVVAVNQAGEIIEVYSENDKDLSDKTVQKFKGLIVPGFINSHCHIELSHLKGLISKQLGLIEFIKNVITKRGDNDDIILAAMQNADKMMSENGIVAVGDICNSEISNAVKQNSSIYYHSYIETLGFDPQKAKGLFQQAIELSKKFSGLSSIVPHAAYSISKEMFRLISKLSTANDTCLTIHNQETEEENKLYRYKTGGFLDFYKTLNVNIDFFKPQARNSIQSLLPLMPINQPIMLVHNIYTSLKDIYFTRRFGRNITWCFCPNANLYIENRLPKIEMFLLGDSITIGTDSLASNDSLCILSELVTLHKHFPSLQFVKTLHWATINGAKFLRIDKQFGSIEVGKKPGLNLITNVDGLNITSKTAVKKLI